MGTPKGARPVFAPGLAEAISRAIRLAKGQLLVSGISKQLIQRFSGGGPRADRRISAIKERRIATDRGTGPAGTLNTTHIPAAVSERIQHHRDHAVRPSP
jgi:hypothetical protein